MVWEYRRLAACVPLAIRRTFGGASAIKCWPLPRGSPADAQGADYKPPVERNRGSLNAACECLNVVDTFATDLFTVEVVNPFGLVRYHLLFVIDIATRCVCIGGISSDPNGEWMKQVARNLTDMWDGFLLGKRYLIHDRDPLFTEAVRGLLRDSGVKPLRLPACRRRDCRRLREELREQHQGSLLAGTRRSLPTTTGAARVHS